MAAATLELLESQLTATIASWQTYAVEITFLSGWQAEI
jgi:hypothetical protein